MNTEFIDKTIQTIESSKILSADQKVWVTSATMGALQVEMSVKIINLLTEIRDLLKKD